MNQIKGAANWLHDHPWVGTSLGAGLLIGCGIGFFWGEAGDAAATVLGSALGAAIAVQGAVWATEARSRREKAEAQEVIGQVFGRVVSAAEAFEEVALAEFPEIEALRDSWHALHGAAAAAELQGSYLRGAFATLGPRGQLAGRRILAAVESLQRALTQPPQELLEAGDVRARQAMSRGMVARLVRSSVDSLEKGMRMDIS